MRGYLDAGQHLVGGVAAVVDDDIIASEGGGVLQDGVQEGLVGLVACQAQPVSTSMIFSDD